MTGLQTPLLAIAVGLAAPAVAQMPDMTTYASSPEIVAAIAKAKRDIKHDMPLIVEPLLRFKPYAANIEYRRGGWPPAVHQLDAEMFYVLKGSGTLLQGGTLIGGKPAGPNNLSGTSLSGAQSRTVSAGDFFVVPANLPHQFPAVNGPLIMIVMHLPIAVAPTP